MHLTEQEQQQINELVAEVEAKSGARMPVAVIGKADAYPEIPWKAFAVGAAVAALFVMVESCRTRIGRVRTLRYSTWSPSWAPAPPSAC